MIRPFFILIVKNITKVLIIITRYIIFIDEIALLLMFINFYLFSRRDKDIYDAYEMT